MENMKFMDKLLDGAGVEWKTISEIFHLKNGYTPSKTNNEYWKDGTVPWFRMEDIRENGQILGNSLQKISDSAVKGGKLFPANSIIISTSATIGEHALITIPYLANQRFTCLVLKSEYIKNFDIKFLFYYCFLLANWCKKNTTKSSFSSVDMDGFRKFEIPIICPENPEKSLKIQAEIVRILDKFTALITELITELTLRKKQYNYYREQLLSFKEGEMEWKTLGDVCNFKNGFAFKSNLFLDTGLPIVRITNINGSSVDLTNVKYFSPSDYKENIQSYAIKSGDILIAMSGATTGKIGCFDSNETAYINQRVGKFIPNNELLNNRYLYHFLLSKTEEIYILAGGGAQPNLSSKNLMEKILIPIPIPYADDPIKSIAEQKKIANILDKLNTLTHSITEGIPREIELRQKQYAYYRNLLLSFPKPEAEDVQ